MKFIGTSNLGMLLLAIYLILVGASAFVQMNLGVVPAIVALVAGVLILIGR